MPPSSAAIHWSLFELLMTEQTGHLNILVRHSLTVRDIRVVSKLDGALLFCTISDLALPPRLRKRFLSNPPFFSSLVFLAVVAVAMILSETGAILALSDDDEATEVFPRSTYNNS